MGYVDGQLLVNPTEEQLKRSDLDLVVAGTRHAVLMVEAGANAVSEALMIDALKLAHGAIVELCAMQERLIAVAVKPKREFALHKIPAELEAKVADLLQAQLAGGTVAFADKSEYDAKVSSYKAAVSAALPDAAPAEVAEAFEGAFKHAVARTDPGQAHPHGWPQPQPGPAHHLRDWAAAAHARFRPVHAPARPRR